MTNDLDESERRGGEEERTTTPSPLPPGTGLKSPGEAGVSRLITAALNMSSFTALEHTDYLPKKKKKKNPIQYQFNLSLERNYSDFLKLF